MIGLYRTRTSGFLVQLPLSVVSRLLRVARSSAPNNAITVASPSRRTPTNLL
jgi:hypothetical protein